MGASHPPTSTGGARSLTRPDLSARAPQGAGLAWIVLGRVRRAGWFLGLASIGLTAAGFLAIIGMPLWAVGVALLVAGLCVSAAADVLGSVG